ncbi:beta-galactosidase [Catenuloplanes japonicus]|uniref:beta-galactosidase n=1 Tax=Catenuloplanes japonicus TaxID=33876 RepID=UPI000A10BD87|nr:beta-galactosidase [Catenuloplanes japonicus]
MPFIEVPADIGAPQTGHLRLGDPSTIEVTSRYLTRDGRPFIPVMGEFHFSRYPAAEWAEELRKIRAGGITMVATYLFWNVHEEERGRFDFTGDRDVRAFVRACGEAGLEVVARLGPWVHGESRHGGFPDWVVAAPVRHRTDDPAYLALIRPYLTEVVNRLRGLDPIVAIQVENELYDQPGHLLTLKHLIRELGLDAPLWTATGWGHAQLPADELLPVFGGYSEAAWDTAHDGWPQQSRAHYFFGPGRDDDSIGADLRTDAVAATDESHLTRYPWATCELGGGMYTSYHRRPIVEADDLAALSLVKIGCGSSLQGFYMYHGGSQKIGTRSTLQESHATGYPNDCPVVNYDFQAPLGDGGQFRPSWFALRQQHLWLADHGHRLAPMTLHLPSDAPRDTADRTTLRWAVRADGDSGYLFVNNHQPVETLPDHDQKLFTVRLGAADLAVPRTPVTIPSGAYFVWPLNQPIGAARIVTATAQPLCDLVVEGVPTAVLSETPGVPLELVVDGVLIDDLVPGLGGLRRITAPDGSAAAILVLDHAAALHATRGTLWGADRLVISAAPVVLDEGTAIVYGPPAPVFVYPPVDGHRTEGVFSVHEFSTGDLTPLPAETTLLQPAGPARDTVLDAATGRASAPADFSTARIVHVTVPEELFADPGTEVLLRIDWTGDVARAHLDGRLIADQFWHGRVWEIPLRRHHKEAVTHGLELRILPRDPEAPIYVSPQVRTGTALEVRAIEFVRRPRTVLGDPR